MSDVGHAIPLREGLPYLPKRLSARPRDERGYPVPWFVSWIDGKPEFRAIERGKIVDAIVNRRCWVCGEKLGRFGAFVIGPMCAINRVSAEPPSHLECAVFSVKACPFLTLPRAQRRDSNMPAGCEPPAGVMIERNPGVALVWSTGVWRHFSPGGKGVLFRLGDPVETLWFAEGREATRAEVDESIETGLPALEAIATVDGPDARAALARQVEAARVFLPASEFSR